MSERDSLGYFQRVDTHCYISRACGLQRVNVDFVIQAVIASGFLWRSVQCALSKFGSRYDSLGNRTTSLLRRASMAALRYTD